MNQSSLVCSNCRTANPPTNLYCQSCGRPLIPVESQPPAVSQPTDATMPIPSAPPYQAQAPAPQPAAYSPPPAYVPPSQPQQPPTYTPPPQGQPPYAAPTYQPPQPPPGYPQGTPPPGYGGGQPQPGYYPPQAARPAPAPALPTLENQGVRVDGWADLIPGAAERAGEVEQGFVEEINKRAFPFARLGKAEFYAGPTRRSFQIFGGAQGSVAVSIAAVGKDLSLSWDLFVKQKPNMRMLAILAGAVVALSLFSSFDSIFFSFSAFLLSFIFGLFGHVLLVVVVGLIAGKVLHGDLFSFLIQKPDLLAQQDLAAMSLAVHQSLHKAIENSGVDLSALRAKNVFKGGDEERRI